MIIDMWNIGLYWETVISIYGDIHLRQEGELLTLGVGKKSNVMTTILNNIKQIRKLIRETIVIQLK